MTGVINASVDPTVEVKARTRAKAKGQIMSEYIEQLIINDYQKSTTVDLSRGLSYQQLVDEAEAKVEEIKKEKATHEVAEAEFTAFQDWFNAHEQDWKQTIIDRFGDGKAVYAKTYWDIVKVQRCFEEKYHDSQFYWHKGLDELELRRLVDAAFKRGG